MGGAAAWALARRGARVCGFEQYGMAHNLGSSHGDVRMIRKAYFEHPDYVPLLQSAYALWPQLEQEAGRQLQVTSGILMAGPPEADTLRGLEQCYQQNDLPHERLSSAMLAERFPQFRLPRGHEGFLDPAGGYLQVEACVEQFLLAAQRHGAELHLHEAVVQWRQLGGSVEIITDQRTIEAGVLVLCAGPWTTAALTGLDLPLQVLRKVQLWYSFPGMQRFAAPSPAFYCDLPYAGIYGFPLYSPDGLKLAEHPGGDPTPGPDSLDRALHPQDEAPLLRFIGEVLGADAPECRRFSVCMYTSTPDQNFILDHLPGQENVLIAAGFSGHGFKFAPVVGEVMADLALERSTGHPVEFLRLSRLLPTPA